MGRSRWFALSYIVLGGVLLLVARLFLPLTDAELSPRRIADYVHPVAATVTGIFGLISLLIGAKKIVSPVTRP